MPHRSDTDFRLTIINNAEFKPPFDAKGNVFVFHYPTEFNESLTYKDGYFNQKYSEFISNLDDDSIVCFLIDSKNACDLIFQLQGPLHFRLWIAIERKTPLKNDNQLPDNHIALPVFTKHQRSFKHAKVQIQYTICPACGKTTKDYGGKKHLYSPYGTLLSDVWRDIKYSNRFYPGEILARLSDLFAKDPYERLYYFDERNKPTYLIKTKPSSPKKRKDSETVLESKLINDDSLLALKKLPENIIDFAFADPPYNINKKYDNWNDDIHIEEYFDWCDKWIAEIHRVLKCGRTFALINIPLWIVRHYIFAKNLFRFQNLIVWEGLGLPVRNIMPAHYGIICLAKGKPKGISNYDTKITLDSIINNSQGTKEWFCLRQSCVKKRNAINITDREPITNLWWDIHRLKHNSKRVDHPCQLPPNLMKRLIYTFTKENEIVLDPFDGAGTTSLVAHMMERRYYGIELSEDYHNIALQRHCEIDKGIDPFAKKKAVPKAKNSRVNRLQKQKYVVPKKTLQLEVRSIAAKIGRKPTRDDVKEYSEYPFKYFEDYFIDWGEVCAAVGYKGMNENPNRGKKENSPQLKLFEKESK